MTEASPGPYLFSFLNSERGLVFRARKDTFLLSLLGQAAILAVMILYFTSSPPHPPNLVSDMTDLRKLAVVFSGMNGGGGGNHETPHRTAACPIALLSHRLCPDHDRPEGNAEAARA